MPLKYFHCPGEPSNLKTLPDCLACDHQCAGGPEWLTTLWNENIANEHPYHNDPKVVSVTETLGCLRRAYYDRMFNYGEEPEKLLSRTLGTAAHSLVEKHHPDGAEVVFDYDLGGGCSLKGTADVSMPGVVRDWKTVDRPTKTLAGGVRVNEDGVKVHQQAEQLSVYADLKELQGEEPVERLEIVQVGRKAIKVHQVYRVDNALETAVQRAHKLLNAVDEGDVSLLSKEGVDIKYFRVNMCSFCPHAGACEGDE